MKNGKHPLMGSGSCRVCGSKRNRDIAEEWNRGQLYHVARCIDCGLVYIRETHEGVSPSYGALLEKDIDAYHIWLQTQHKHAAFRQCLDLIHGSLPRVNSASLGGYLLDVGCGIGGWLDYAASHTGFMCFGYDSSLAQTSYARRKFPMVRCAASLRDYSDKLNYLLPRFSLVTLWDVLEHIGQPLELIKELAGQISDGGLIFASVPAALPQIIKQRLLKFGWPRGRFSWYPHEHLIYYSPQTLTRLFQDAGLKVLKVGSVKVYPRPLSVYEICRRATFRVLSGMPSFAPQIYILAKGK
jgi:2-polyprenyl-3-methyl-5-hydroxy-6-metoxy-1,4-benzoquinol methylase